MATTHMLYKGKKELTMAQFEALTELDDAVDYDIVDFPNTAITNAQMTAALGYTRLFSAGEVFVCADDGTYTKGHAYQVKVNGDVKSWEDITPTSGTPKSYRHFIQFTAGGYTVYYDFTSTRATSYTASNLPSMPENAISTFEIIANGKYSSVSGLIYRNGEGLLKAILHGLYTTDGTTQSYLELNGVDVTFVSDTVGEL